MKIVYLAGPIFGMSYVNATKWRNEASEILKDAGYSVYNPMSNKEHLKDEDFITTDPLKAARQIVEEDLWRVRNSDILLVNMNGDNMSIGTMFEIGYARALNKMLIIVADNDSVYATHDFISENSIVVSSMSQALDIITNL